MLLMNILYANYYICTWLDVRLRLQRLGSFHVRKFFLRVEILQKLNRMLKRYLKFWPVLRGIRYCPLWRVCRLVYVHILASVVILARSKLGLQCFESHHLLCRKELDELEDRLWTCVHVGYFIYLSILMMVELFFIQKVSDVSILVECLFF